MNKRNTSKEKRKENKKFPYKVGGKIELKNMFISFYNVKCNFTTWKC